MELLQDAFGWTAFPLHRGPFLAPVISALRQHQHHQADTVDQQQRGLPSVLDVEKQAKQRNPDDVEALEFVILRQALNQLVFHPAKMNHAGPTGGRCSRESNDRGHFYPGNEPFSQTVVEMVRVAKTSL